MTTFDRESFLEDLWHRTQIHDVLMRFARGIDRMDLDLLASAYHEGAYDDHGTYKGDVPGLLDWVRRRHVHVEQSMHTICNCLIERVDDVAVVESYVLAFQRFSPEAAETRAMYLPPEEAAEPRPLQLLITVRYLDRFELRDGRWGIVHRSTAIESVRVSAGDPDLPRGVWIDQVRGPEDAIWAMRADAGLPSTAEQIARGLI